MQTLLGVLRICFKALSPCSSLIGVRVILEERREILKSKAVGTTAKRSSRWNEDENVSEVQLNAKGKRWAGGGEEGADLTHILVNLTRRGAALRLVPANPMTCQTHFLEVLEAHGTGGGDEGRELDLGEAAQRRPTRPISRIPTVVGSTNLLSLDTSPGISWPFYGIVMPKRQESEVVESLGSARWIPGLQFISPWANNLQSLIGTTKRSAPWRDVLLTFLDARPYTLISRSLDFFIKRWSSKELTEYADCGRVYTF